MSILSAILAACNLGGTKADLDQSLKDDRSVRVAIENRTQSDIDRIFLGSIYQESIDSYTFTTYQTTYKNLGMGKTSQFKPVHNIPRGYDTIQIHFSDGTKKTIAQEDVMKSAVDFTSKVSWEHPYSKEEFSADGLVSGDYVFSISGADPLRISIAKL